MALVIYRKYRPKNFSEVIGQEHVVQTLTNAIENGTISHAYLFAGPRGSGKTTIARIFAKAINCENLKKYEPCNQCFSCTEINTGKALDLIEIDAASHRGIDEVRELKEGIKFPPSKLKYKVFIIDESHQLTKEAANALLKTLEEPPPHAIFILATTEIHKMIPTIISRCQRFDFRRLKVPEIVKRLQVICEKEGVKMEDAALELIAQNAGGSIRDAESILDQALNFIGAINQKKEIKEQDIQQLLGLVQVNTVSQFCDFLFSKNASKAIAFLNEIQDRGMDLQEFNKALVNYLRQGLILKITAGQVQNPLVSGLTKEQFQKLQSQIINLKEEEIKQLLNLFLEAGNKMKYSSIAQLPLELAIVEFCEIN